MTQVLALASGSWVVQDLAVAAFPVAPSVKSQRAPHPGGALYKEFRGRLEVNLQSKLDLTRILEREAR